MKRILFFILLIPFIAKSQDDSTKYINYRFEYGKKMARVMPDSILHTPYLDTTFKPVRPGALTTRPADNLIYWWNGVKWNLFGSGTGTTFDTTTIYNNIALKLNKSDSTAGGYYPYSSNPKGYLIAADIAGKLNISDTANKWVNSLRRRSGTDTVEQLKNGTWQFGYTDSTGGIADIVTPSSSTITLSSANHYVFTGSTATTWTLPTPSLNKVLFVKNRGSGTLTISGGGHQIYDAVTSSSYILLPGDAARFIWDTTYWSVSASKLVNRETIPSNDTITIDVSKGYAISKFTLNQNAILLINNSVDGDFGFIKFKNTNNYSLSYNGTKLPVSPGLNWMEWYNDMDTLEFHPNPSVVSIVVDTSGGTPPPSGYLTYDYKQDVTENTNGLLGGSVQGYGRSVETFSPGDILEVQHGDASVTTGIEFGFGSTSGYPSSTSATIFGIYLNSSTIYKAESGSFSSVGSYSVGDYFRVVYVDATHVKYQKSSDGVTYTDITTSSVTPSGTYKAVFVIPATKLLKNIKKI